MTIPELLQRGREIWGDRRMELPEIAVALGVVHGDICRKARDELEGKPRSLTPLDLQRELGNLILSAIRWCDDLGLDPEECVRHADVAQRTYVEERRNS